MTDLQPEYLFDRFLESVTDLNVVVDALAREQVIRQVMTETGESRQPRTAEMRNWQRRDRAANPEKHQAKNRAHNLRRNYGMTVGDYDRMRADQEYRCAICGRHEDEIPVKHGGRPRLDGSRATRPPLVVDHCHTTGRVRKLLCDRCNHLLGHAGEDIAVLQAAARYLTQMEPAPCP